ncbi:MAG: ATP-dependent protease subunit HslV [Armatimonadetes bacterium]|jgi:ATP-dependent HslUV protease subunit HslV|nr:ATP-dependent protease subunit HslV [Armatimonadota bacterium]
MIRSTTVVAVRRGGRTAIASDGQVTLGGAVILKHGARKVRRLSGGQAVCGFAGSVADAQALQDRFEAKFEAFGRNLRRAAVEFAKEWRTDRILRQLDAMMVVADSECLLLVGGDGNVVEPDDGVVAIGSGGPYALAAARALLRHSELGAEQIAETALRIAAEICVFTNDRISLETVE